MNMYTMCKHVSGGTPHGLTVSVSSHLLLQSLLFWEDGRTEGVKEGSRTLRMIYGISLFCVYVFSEFVAAYSPCIIAGDEPMQHTIHIQ